MKKKVIEPNNWIISWTCHERKYFRTSVGARACFCWQHIKEGQFIRTGVPFRTDPMWAYAVPKLALYKLRTCHIIHLGNNWIKPHQPPSDCFKHRASKTMLHPSVFQPVPLADKLPNSNLNALAVPTAMEAATADAKKKKQTRRRQAKTLEKIEANGVEDIEDFSPEEAASIRASLLRWYDENGRDLPWRAAEKNQQPEEDRAYAVWVSEVMLQQTRVPVVAAYYQRWMARWPTLRRLAQASQEEVNEMWAGLGYYRRARFLLEGAKSIVQKGKFPRTAAELRGVRGIGEYTAGAIASIAFNEVVPVVDGNVVRVISRIRAISANPKEAATVKSFWKLAGQLADPSRPGDFNQAIMELGATLCSKSSPGCTACPVSNQCHAFLLSRNSEKSKVTDYPTKVVKAKQRNDFAAVCVVEIAGSLGKEVMKGSNEKHVFLLVKRPEEGLLAGLWEFPSVLLDEENIDQRTRRKAMNNYLNKLFKLNVLSNRNMLLREDVGEYVHVFSHIRLHMHVELLILTLEGGIHLDNEEKRSTVTWKCVDGNSMKSIGLTSGVRKVYDMIQDFKQKQLPQHPKRARRRR